MTAKQAAAAAGTQKVVKKPRKKKDIAASGSSAATGADVGAEDVQVAPARLLSRKINYNFVENLVRLFFLVVLPSLTFESDFHYHFTLLVSRSCGFFSCPEPCAIFSVRV